MCTAISKCCSEKEGHGSAALMDVMGLLTAVICLVHCLAIPILLSFLPTLPLLDREHDVTHYILIGWVISFCTFSILPNYRKQRKKSIIIVMLLGLIAVFAATFHGYIGLNTAYELPVITAGNFLIMSAHILNRQSFEARESKLDVQSLALNQSVTADKL